MDRYLEGVQLALGFLTVFLIAGAVINTIRYLVRANNNAKIEAKLETKLQEMKNEEHLKTLHRCKHDNN